MSAYDVLPCGKARLTKRAAELSVSLASWSIASAFSDSKSKRHQDVCELLSLKHAVIGLRDLFHVRPWGVDGCGDRVLIVLDSAELMGLCDSATVERDDVFVYAFRAPSPKFMM